MLAWPCVRISKRRASSTTARFVRAPLLRIACRIKSSSISMFVRMSFSEYRATGAIRLLAGTACTAYTKCMQYTIRGIPTAVDAALRQRARAGGKSLNEAAVDALTEGSGMAGKPRKRRDLGDIAGSWKSDKAIEAALADQDRVDEDLWR